MSLHVINNGKEYDDIVSKSGIVVVKFGASWCGPCKRIQPTYELFARKFDKVTFCSVDKDTMDAAGDFDCAEEIQTVPTFLLYLDGEPQTKVVGTDMAKLEDEIRALK